MYYTIFILYDLSVNFERTSLDVSCVYIYFFFNSSYF